MRDILHSAHPAPDVIQSWSFLGLWTIISPASAEHVVLWYYRANRDDDSGVGGLVCLPFCSFCCPILASDGFSKIRFGMMLPDSCCFLTPFWDQNELKFSVAVHPAFNVISRGIITHPHPLFLCTALKLIYLTFYCVQDYQKKKK